MRAKRAYCVYYLYNSVEMHKEIEKPNGFGPKGVMPNPPKEPHKEPNSARKPLFRLVPGHRGEFEKSKWVWS